MNHFILFEFVCTAMLTGLIWTIQLINYPQLRTLGESDFRKIHLFHMNAITPLVAPLMILELFFCGLNFYQKNYSVNFSCANLFIIFIIWGATFFISVPLHEKLLKSPSKDNLLISKLILTNWIRTFGWTLKLFLLIKYFI